MRLSLLREGIDDETAAVFRVVWHLLRLSPAPCYMEYGDGGLILVRTTRGLFVDRSSGREYLEYFPPDLEYRVETLRDA